MTPAAPKSRRTAMDQMTDAAGLSLSELLDCVRDGPEEGRFEVARRIFADPAIFELEMRNIFESTWVYLAHESQIPQANDFVAARIGRSPVLVTRGEDGQVHAFLNSCSHRGAELTASKRGNKRHLTCPYHGWVYDSAGRCVNVDAKERGGYPTYFETLSHDLAKVRVGVYRGFIFGSLNDAVEPIEQHLGGAARVIDAMADQSPDGLELVRGGIRYTCNANWKMQLENIDGYHFFPVHTNYIGLIVERQKKAGNTIKTIDPTQMASLPGGCYQFENGHIMDWALMPNGDERPLGFQRERITREFGPDQAQWMIDAIRNLAIFPNLLLMDQSSSTVRIVHPLAVDRTLVEVYCVAPKGEPAAARERRLRQFEDFLGPAGMATPDDQSVMEACQRGFTATGQPYLQGHFRGAARQLQGADDNARRLGLAPQVSTGDIDDEVFTHGQYRQWLRLMTQAG
ncbi:MAG TPA: benzoate 1,2-dioxygenase large subunit [Gammaproteobacteria bacterium]|nr:benzoate 1,2-dioxygenase large subunit [Gammaproteobacteria bacterium]